MSRATDRERLLQAAMNDLMGHPAFGIFIDTIRDLKEEAVRYAVDHTTVKDQRESLSALGEVRAYYNILAIYDNNRPENVMAVSDPEAQYGR